jgi:hypothetical protein
VEAAPAEGKEPTIVAGQREKKNESNRVQKLKQEDDDDDDDDNEDKRTRKHDSGEDRKRKKEKEHDDDDDGKYHENGKVKNKNNGKDKHKDDDDDDDKYEKNLEEKDNSTPGTSVTPAQDLSTAEQGSTVTDREESSTAVTPVTPAQDLSTAEQDSTVTDREESSTAGTSVTPAQDLSTAEQGPTVTDSEEHMTGTEQVSTDVTTQQVQLTTEITTPATYVPVTTKPQACDVKDIALLYVQYVLKSLGENADGNILYSGHEVPVQFFVRVLTLQGADIHDVTTDNLRYIAVLYITYDLHELPRGSI